MSFSASPAYTGGVRNAFPDDGRLTLNLDEAPKILGVSRAYAYAAARDGSLPTIRIGRRWLVSRSVVERLLSGHLAIKVRDEKQG
jgi:excisionase family DNA binding protein